MIYLHKICFFTTGLVWFLNSVYNSGLVWFLFSGYNSICIETHGKDPAHFKRGIL